MIFHHFSICFVVCIIFLKFSHDSYTKIISIKVREKSPYYERSRSEDHLENKHVVAKRAHVYETRNYEDELPPPVPPLPLQYEPQSDGK